MTAPLRGIRVVSLAGQLPGPYAAMLLAELGAEVTFVEPVGGDPLRMVRELHEPIVRCCQTVELDLKSSDGARRALELCEVADIVLEGFRPGVASRLGVGPEHVQARKADVVYVSISAFGQTGPYAQRPAHDIVSQAVAGALHMEAGNPPSDLNPPPLSPWADMAAAVFAVVGALAGLHRRSITNDGSTVDVSMTDSLIALLAPIIAGGKEQNDFRVIPETPGYGIYWTSDRVPVALGIVHEDHFWDSLCNAIDRPDLAGSSIVERWEKVVDLNVEVRSAIEGLAWADVEGRFTTFDLPFAKVNRVEEVPNDPHVKARGPIQREGNRTIIHQPALFDGERPKRPLR